jgi:GNAT superfamily N-acetyltransferase
MTSKIVYRADSRSKSQLTKGFETWVPELTLEDRRDYLRVNVGVKKTDDCSQTFKGLVSKKQLEVNEKSSPSDLMRLIITEKSKKRPTISTDIEEDCGGQISKGYYIHKIEIAGMKEVDWKRAVDSKVVVNALSPKLFLDKDTLDEATQIAVWNHKGGATKEFTFLTNIPANCIKESKQVTGEKQEKAESEQKPKESEEKPKTTEKPPSSSSSPSSSSTKPTPPSTKPTPPPLKPTSSPSSSTSQSGSGLAEIKVAQTAQEFLDAHKTFTKSIPKEKDKGYTAIAAQCVNGLPGFWDLNTKKRGEMFVYSAAGQKIQGLLRIQIEKDAVKLQDVVGHPDIKGSGAALVQHTIDVAKKKGFKKVWLEAADEGVGTYYKRYGFEFTTSNAKSGQMTLKVE